MAKSYSCDEKDESLFNSFIKPRLKSKEKVRLFCSFTYITPNYINLFIINELAKLAKEGYELFIVIWDMNSITNKYFKRQVVHALGAESPSAFMDKKVQEVEQIFSSLGVESAKLHIYKSSDVWKRMVNIQSHDLFLKLYSVLASMKIGEFSVQHKLSYIIQIPTDIFFANNFNLLYPEDTDKPMDIALIGYNKEDIYQKARQLMYDEGIIKMEKPVFLITKHIPNIIVNESVPEWNMSLEEIIRILNNFSFSENDAKELFEIILKDTTSPLFYYDLKENIIESDTAQIIKILDKLPVENKIFTIAYNLYNYMQYFKNKVGHTKILSKIMTVKGNEDIVSIGRIFKSKPLIETLRLADCTKTISQIAKISKRQVANISMYVGTLKKLGFVIIDDKGKVKRAYDAIKLNLNSSLSI